MWDGSGLPGYQFPLHGTGVSVRSSPLQGSTRRDGGITAHTVDRPRLPPAESSCVSRHAGGSVCEPRYPILSEPCTLRMKCPVCNCDRRWGNGTRSQSTTARSAGASGWRRGSSIRSSSALQPPPRQRCRGACHRARGIRPRTGDMMIIITTIMTRRRKKGSSETSSTNPTAFRDRSTGPDLAEGGGPARRGTVPQGRPPR